MHLRKNKMIPRESLGIISSLITQRHHQLSLASCGLLQFSSSLKQRPQRVLGINTKLRETYMQSTRTIHSSILSM